MVLVDTSILICYFRGINNQIYQEILQGSSSEKEFNMLKEYLETQNFYDLLQGKNPMKKQQKNILCVENKDIQ